jgi:flagellar assembly factor FliW
LYERKIQMSFNAKRFGQIDVPEDKVIRFMNGIPGLECMRRSILIKVEETMPFYWLQSVEDGDIALPVVNPLIIDETYSPSVEDSVFDELELDKEEDLLVVSVAVIPQDITKMTVNMAAPMLINIEKNIGRQVILDNSDYPMRLAIYETLFSKLKEEHDRAGTDQKGE